MFIDWRYSQSCWYFRPNFANCCSSNLLSGSTLSPFPCVKYTVYIKEGGMGFWASDRSEPAAKFVMCFTQCIFYPLKLPVKNRGKYFIKKFYMIVLFLFTLGVILESKKVMYFIHPILNADWINNIKLVFVLNFQIEHKWEKMKKVVQRLSPPPGFCISAKKTRYWY